MSTHIIIPIKDIDNLLDKIQSACNLPQEATEAALKYCLTNLI